MADNIVGGVHQDKVNPAKTKSYDNNKLTSEKRVRDIATDILASLEKVSIQLLPVEVREVFYNERDIDADEDLSYKDIGAIRFRPFKGFKLPTDKAFPLNSNIKYYPVFGEMVHVILVGKEAFYYDPINIKREVNNNSAIGITADFPLHQTEDAIYNLSKGFSSSTRVRPTRHVAGDIVIDGRLGQSIKIGRNKGYYKSNELISDPVVKLRLANPNTDTSTRHEPKEENLIDDAASIYLTFSEEVKLSPARLVRNDNNRMTPTLHSGKQIILDSDGIVFNTKLGVNNDIKMYSGADVNIVSKGDTKIVGKNVYIGDAKKKGSDYTSGAENAVLGEALVELLYKMSLVLEAAGLDLQSGNSIGNLGMPAPDPQSKMAGTKIQSLFSGGDWTREKLRDALLSKHVYISRNSPGE